MDNQEFNACKICGDKANGYNFDVLSCTSCKSFFRRHANNGWKFYCKNNQQCQISKPDRKLCRLCRLIKCFACGMKKEWILSDEQRKVRKSNKVKTGVNRESVIQSLNLNKITDKSGLETHEVFEKVPNGQIDLDKQADVPSSSTDENLKGHSHRSDINNDVSFLQENETNLELISICRPITDYRNNLTEIEGKYLTELQNSTTILKTPMATITSEAITFNDAVHALCSARRIDVERLVTMAKSLVAIKDVDRNDRLAIIKSGVMEMFYMRNVTGYFNDGLMKYLILPTDNQKTSTCLVRLDLFRQTKPYLYEANKNFYETMANEWDNDYVILDLMSAIVLFRPDRKSVSDSHQIKIKQHIYKYLMQRYLLLKYRTEEKAVDKYIRLMRSLKLVEILHEKNRRNAMEGNCCMHNEFDYDFVGLIQSLIV